MIVNGKPPDDHILKSYYLEAQERIAQMYQDGKGTSQDYNKAIYWYKKFIEGTSSLKDSNENNLNQIKAMFFLEFCYYQLQDLNSAIYWYNLAAQRGSSEAMINVGLIYYQNHKYTDAVQSYENSAT